MVFFYDVIIFKRDIARVHVRINIKNRTYFVQWVGYTGVRGEFGTTTEKSLKTKTDSKRSSLLTGMIFSSSQCGR